MHRSVIPYLMLLQFLLVDHTLAANVNISSSTSEDDGASSNESSTNEHCAETVGPRGVNIAAHTITLIASLTGNTLILVSFVRMKEPIMLLIANMAASDLLVAIFLLPRLITRETIRSNAFLVDGNVGLFLCKMCFFLADISLSVSTLSLVLIAVERFLAVVNPVYYKLITVKTRRVLVVSTWIIAMAIHSPYFYIIRLEKEADYKVCAPNKSTAIFHYSIFLYVTVLIVPILVISVLYTVLVIKLRRDKMVSYRSDKGARRIKKRNNNLKNMAVATVAAFLICWTLYIGIMLLRLFSPAKVPKCNHNFQVVFYISKVLATSYCAVNPWFCFVFVRNFTRELSRICKRKLRPASKFTDRKVESRTLSRDTSRTEIRQSLSESMQITTLLSISNEKKRENPMGIGIALYPIISQRVSLIRTRTSKL